MTQMDKKLLDLDIGITLIVIQQMVTKVLDTFVNGNLQVHILPHQFKVIPLCLLRKQHKQCPVLTTCGTICLVLTSAII